MLYKYKISLFGGALVSYARNGIELDQYVQDALRLTTKTENIAITVILEEEPR